MYWYGAQEDTTRTVNRTFADRALGILVVTGRTSSPCPSEDLQRTLASITLNEMLFGAALVHRRQGYTDTRLGTSMEYEGSPG